MQYAISASGKKIFTGAMITMFSLVLAGFFAAYLQNILKYEVAFGFIPMFHLDYEFNAPTLFSVFVISLNAFMLLLISKHIATVKKAKKYWRILSYIFLYLSIDEFASLHERLGGIAHSVAPNLINLSSSRYWFLPIGILLILFSIYFIRFFLSLPANVKVNFATAGLIYIAGAMGVEYLGDLYIKYYKQAGIYYSLLSCFEELLEMTGMIFFLRTLLFHLQTLSGSNVFVLQLSIGGNKLKEAESPSANIISDKMTQNDRVL